VREEPKQWAGPLGLTERETYVLGALGRVGPSPLGTLEARTGLPARILREALDRIIELGYVTAAGTKGDPLYTAVRPPGP
jgi:hypothetical protein